MDTFFLGRRFVRKINQLIKGPNTKKGTLICKYMYIYIRNPGPVVRGHSVNFRIWYQNHLASDTNCWNRQPKLPTTLSRWVPLTTPKLHKSQAWETGEWLFKQLLTRRSGASKGCELWKLVVGWWFKLDDFGVGGVLFKPFVRNLLAFPREVG